MAHVVHHHDAGASEVPPRVFWAAGIGIALLAALIAFATAPAGNPAIPMAPIDPSLPFIPFVPVF